MKIIQVNTVCGSGSVGRIVVDLYKIAEDAGMECIAAYGRGTAPAGISGYLIGNRPDFYRHVLRNFFRGESGFGSGAVTERFIKWLEAQKPDVIHLHNIHGFYLQVEKLFAYLKQTKVKVIWTLHDCWPFTGHCAYFDYAGCGKWKEGCHHCPQHVRAYPYAIFRDNSRQAYLDKKQAFTGVKNLTVVTPSKWLAQLVGQSFLKEYDVRIIPNGIDLTLFQPTKYRGRLILPEKKVVLGVANVWEARKGLPYFEELLKKLPSEYQLVLVGLSGRQKKALAKKYKEERLVPLTRTKDARELAALYTRADVYVNLTLEDNFPTTNLEALACGTPVVTFDTGGSPEALGEGLGKVVPQKDVGQVMEAVKALMREEKPVEACRKRALLYGKEKRFEEYIALYRE